MAVMDELQQKRGIMLEIAARHGASNLRVFGSAVRGEERSDSDIDLLVDLAEDRGFDDYLALAEELENLIGRRIDLVLGRSLSPHFRPFIEAEARRL
jgi:predicted nucleotidyltransferase